MGGIDDCSPDRIRLRLSVLGRVVTAQRWGIPAAVADEGWSAPLQGRLAPRPSPASWSTRCAACARDGTSVSLAVLTDGDPSMDYGDRDRGGVAGRLFSP